MRLVGPPDMALADSVFYHSILLRANALFSPCSEGRIGVEQPFTLIRQRSDQIPVPTLNFQNKFFRQNMTRYPSLDIYFEGSSSVVMHSCVCLSASTLVREQSPGKERRKDVIFELPLSQNQS